MLQAARFAWATLCCNVAVVLWGAYVRATGSGAGCGNKWPTCDGEVLGTSAGAHTIIEFTHRITSGIALVMVACLVVWCWRVTSKSNWARYSSVLAAVFLANEALLGGALVLLDYVGTDKSVGRILFLCLHFGNTLLLLAALSLTAVWLSNGSGRFTLIRSRRHVGAVGIGLCATMALGITGVISALGDTLFPATSLRLAILQDFGRGTPALLRFRLLHPLVAVITACYLLWIFLRISTQRSRVSQAAIALITAVFVQIGIGLMNVLFLAPLFLQILHLFVADVIWISLVLASSDIVLQRADALAGYTPAKHDWVVKSASCRRREPNTEPNMT
jgi:cytochrome c oxidase assembly protein subunit 15